MRDLWVDMNTTFDKDYGKSKVYSSDPYPTIQVLQRSKVVFQINNAQFFSLYADLLTRPVPVHFSCEEHHSDLDD